MSYWKTLRRVMAALVAVTAISIVANASNEFAVHPAYASTIVQTFKPVADAWVNAAAPDKVSGTGYELQVDGTPVQIAYFNFNLSALSGTVISATLKLSVTGNGSVDGGSVSTVSDTSWTEMTLTYNNRPAISAPIASIGAAPANQAVTIDVTSAVTSSGMLGLAVASTNGDGVSYASRENSLPPLLTVTVGTSTPTSTATSTTTATATSTGTTTPTATSTGTPTSTATATATGTATTTATTTATATGTATATATPSPTPTGTPISTQTYIFRASADAYANSSAPDTVSGTGFEIPVDGSPDRLDYMTFNVTGLTGTVISATLKLSTTWDGSVDGGTIGKVLDTSWTESTLTYNNRPSISPPTVSIGSVVPYQSVTKDVTAAITGNGPAGFAISSTNGDGVTYASRENSTPPILTIVTGIYSTATPTPTATATSTATATATATATTTATATATGTPTPTATPFSGPVIAAAGDISCDPTSSHYFNGLGDPTHCQQMATSNLLINMQPTAVLTLGDNQYMENTLAQFQAVFDGTWGRLKSIIHPAIGNHEYLTANAAGYFAYFGAAAGDPSKGYYSYDIGSWHIITLNSECAQIGGCNKGSPEEIWLNNDLATHSNQCTLAVWHEPEFDSGPNGSGTFYLDFWNDLYRGGADVILNGHSHLYERFGPQTPTGVADPAHGIVQFTVGSGGEDLDTFHSIRPNSMARDSDDFGVLKMTLGDGGYSWQFVTIPGSSGFTDSGSASCHAAP